MQRKDVIRYEKMVGKFKTAWENLGKHIEEHFPDAVGTFKGIDENVVKVDTPLYNYYLEYALYLEDGTHVLDDWERAEAFDKEFQENVKLSNQKGDHFIVKSCGCNGIIKEVKYVRDIIANELDGYWLPLLDEKGGYYNIPTDREYSPLGTSGFIGGCVRVMIQVLQGLDELRIYE